MKHVPACFVCTTPFQLMTAMNVASLRKIEADLYVVPQFAAADDLSRRIRELGIFREVVLVATEGFEKYKRRKSRFLRHLGIAANYLKVASIVQSFHLPNVSYEAIYLSSKANVGRLMRLHYLKEGRRFKTIFFDDGESSYDNLLRLRPTRFDAFLQKALFGPGALADGNELLLYSPELHRRLNPASPFRVGALPPIGQDEATRKMFNHVFRYSPEDALDGRAVILDIHRWENLCPGEEGNLDAAYRMLLSRFGAGNVILKRHPRDPSPADPSFRQYTKASVPFEVILLNMDLKGKV
ncbi:MAG: hypothetical protein J6Y19_07655, partial [Kiritimatiellae bacterium]|nr:hypothetical protein [Kiritimatiellia bacterium]